MTNTDSKLPKPVTQKDLKTFEKKMLETLDVKFENFIDAFWESMNSPPADDNQEPCNCPDCQAAANGDDIPEPPARHLVQTSSGPVWCDMHKAICCGIATFQIIKIMGKNRNVLGHITPEVSTFDFGTNITPEQFSKMSDKDLETVIQQHEKAQEHKPDLSNYG
jgi:hypothetical protein